jgi:serine protease Do
MDSRANAFDYPKELPVYSCGEEYFAQKEGNKYIYINQAEVQLKAGDYTSSAIPYSRYSVGDMTPFSFAHLSGVYSNQEEVEGESPEFQKILNNVLLERGFMDTTGTILKKMNNTLYIDATLSKWGTKSIYRAFMNASTVSFMVADFEFNWVLRDVYKKVLYEEKIQITTDEFKSITVGYSENSSKKSLVEAYDKVIKNGLEKSLLTFLSRPQVQNLLPITEEQQLSETVMLSKGTGIVPAKLSEATKACVTIVLGKSHGSGFFVNDDHVLTNYHVVSDLEFQGKIKVVVNDGTELIASVVRKTEDFDLALIKVESFKSPYFFDLHSVAQSEIGDEIYAIGTPASVEFSQTVSKGIISGKRKTTEVDLIQTDVSINAGNSGGPIVNADGKLIGVVNGKLVGENVEGIGFAIPAGKIKEYLNIRFI